MHFNRRSLPSAASIQQLMPETAEELSKKPEARQQLARFRVSENTWLEAIVRYVVPPREAGTIKSRLIKKLLAALNAEPDKVMFPAGANR
jgi:hypothetical protein